MTITVDTEYWELDHEDATKRGNFRCAAWIANEDDTQRIFATTNPMTLAKEVQHHETFIGHNVTSDLRMMVRWGIQLPKTFHIIDTMLLARILHPLYPKKDLKTLARLYGYPLVDLHNVKNTNKLIEYCSADTYVTHQLWKVFSDEFKSQSRVTPSVMGMNFQFARSFMFLELAGMKLDHTFLRKEQQRLDAELAGYVKRLQNPESITNNNILLRELQFEYDAPVLEKYLGDRDKTLRVQSDLLEMLPSKPDWLVACLAAREAAKYKTLYVDKLLTYGDYINPNFSILMAKTHRRSTSPTIQNWPGSARQAVTSRFKGGVIVEGDMKNLEARLTGVQAGCKKFVKDMVSSGYLGVAARTLGVDVKGITKQDPKYTETKSTVLAVTYNMSPGLFAYREWIQGKGKKKKRKWKDVEENTYRAFFDAYPEIEEEIERRKEYGLIRGVTDSWCNAHLPLPLFNKEWIENSNIAWQIPILQGKLENFSVNWPTQQFASYVTGCALIDLHRKIIEYYYDGNYGKYATACWTSRTTLTEVKVPIVIGEVHDSLIVDSPKQEVKRVIQFMHDAMCGGESLRRVAPNFPKGILDVEINESPYWKKS